MTAKRINKACTYYPCHNGLEDCTFCYCPFYPCLDEDKGNLVYSKKLDKKIWSCKDCSWIHKKSVVDKIFDLIRNSFSAGFLNRRSKKEKTGIVIIGHGSQIKKANKTITEIIKFIRKEGWENIEPAYFQFLRPDLSDSIKKLAKARCKDIIIVPCFLYNGNHVSKDIPELIKREMKNYKSINFKYAKNLGAEPGIGEIIMRRIEEVILDGNT